MLVSTSISGCSLFSKQGAEYAAGVVNIKVESTIIKSQYEKIYTLIVSNKSKFSEEEWKQLMDVHFAFSEASIRVEKVIDNPKNIITPSELRQMYELAYIGYVQAREILVIHETEFTKYQWVQLNSFDAQALRYDKQVRAILDNPSTEDVNITLGIIITLSSVTYKYLLPVLVSMI